jgi:8-oxo-dGTP pyrophosphatase MutT (NUDIX family)
MDEPAYEALIEASRRDDVHDLVVGAYIVNESSSVLLLQRSASEFKANLYELPSGGIEKDESIFQALCREVKEETSLRVKEILRYVGNFDYINEDGRLARQLNFLASVENTDTVMLSDEHQNWGWFSRAEADSELLDEPTKRQLARYFELFPKS